jgi:branched-chain amino acid transport system ATP-binding protein
MREKVILETQNLSKQFGGFVAVEKVNYKLFEGETAGIIGPNGAGKSTFFNLLTGLFPPTEGKILFFNQDITSTQAEHRVELGLVRTFQLVSVFDSLSVIDNLILAVTRFSPIFTNKFRFFFRDAHIKNITERAKEALNRVGLADKSHILTSELSYGDKRKLEIAMALALNPKVLLLDEPFAGLSDVEIKELLNLLHKVKKSLTLIIIEHKISRIVDLVTRLSVMHEGRIIAEGNPKDVLCNETVRRVYWGGESCSVDGITDSSDRRRRP